MRRKEGRERNALVIRGFVSLLFVLHGGSAEGEVLVKGVEPYPQYTHADTSYVLSYAGAAGAGGGTAGTTQVDTLQGFRVIDTNDLESYITFDVSSDSTFTLQADEQVYAAIATSNSTSEAIAITAAEVASGTSEPSAPSCRGLYSCYTPNTSLRLKIKLQDICSRVGAGTTFCGTSTSILDPASQTPKIVSRDFYVIFFKTTNIDSSSFTTVDSGVFKIQFSAEPPSITCDNSSPEKYYFPGDTEIIFSTKSVAASDSSGVALQKYLLLLRNGSAPSSLPTGFSDSILNRFDATLTEVRVTGLTNTTDGVDNAYQGALYIVNQAGLIGEEPTTCALPGPIQSQTITGVLDSGRCFIATAAFQGLSLKPVQILRRFRDTVLLRLPMGSDFVESYYRWSRTRSIQVWKSPFLRHAALHFLWPLTAFASVINAFAEELGQSPYIDRMKAKMKEDPTSGASDSSKDYSKIEKEKLDREKKIISSDGYTERLRSKLEPEKKEDVPGTYIDQQKKNLPPEDADARPSVIDTVKANTYRAPDPFERAKITQGASFKVGLATGATVSVNGSAAEFERVYGTGWQPEVIFHYEKQPFHHERLGSLGLTFDFGFAQAGGYGTLAFPYAGSTVSRTSFNFIQVPILGGVNYRLNALHILRPYISVAAGVMGYTEIRTDSRPDYRGYSLIATGSVGASILLDFLDRKTMVDAYNSFGFQHIFLFVEFLAMRTLSGPVTFERGGIYSGFLFEF